MYWVKKEGKFKYIGIDKSAVDIYEGINNIKFPDDNVILKGEPLFEVDTNTNIDNKFNSKVDTYIVEKNNNVMETLNLNPKSENESWILKIKDFNDEEHYSFSKFKLKHPKGIKTRKNRSCKKIL